MGNTGSFMLRWRQYKYIVFGTSLNAFHDYKPQLFDLNADPDEMHDIAATHPAVAKAMEAKLNAHYDYQAVDRECKANDLKIYRRFFERAMGKQKLMHQFEQAYTGFDQEDMAKVQAWATEASGLLPAAAQSEEPRYLLPQ